MSVKRNVRYKCPFCDNRMSKEDLVVHIQDDHEDELPKVNATSALSEYFTSM